MKLFLVTILFITLLNCVISTFVPEALQSDLTDHTHLDEELDNVKWKYVNYNDENIAFTCNRTHSIVDFPDDLFTWEQLAQGAVVLHFIGAFYFFTVTAVIINDYFLPSVQCICDDLHLSQDVAAATFMATATTMPEFFTNTISTFIAKSDMGLGNIIGSLMCNMLVVAAIIGFVDTAGGKMCWWQATRDCLMLGINISLLIAFAWDIKIQWWEGMILFITLPFYYLIMFQNEKIKKYATKLFDEKWNMCGRLKRSKDIEKPGIGHQPELPTNHQSVATVDTKSITLEKPNLDLIVSDVKRESIIPEKRESVIVTYIKKQRKSLWRLPQGSLAKKIWWWYTWPIKLILTILIPSPKTYRRLYPLSFVMCIICIGGISYLTVWMLTVIGYVLNIPESVMGLTFLSLGGCLPEIFAGLIMAMKGQGASNFSNSLGTNSLSILFSLGFPWFLRGAISKGQGLEPYVLIGSHGIQYIILSLLAIVLILYLVLYISKYRLIPMVSFALLGVYAVFLTFAILVELDVIIASHPC